MCCWCVESEQRPFSESYTAAEAGDGAVYGTVMLVILSSCLTVLVLSDVTSLSQALHLLKYNLHLRDAHPFRPDVTSPGGGNSHQTQPRPPPPKYSAYYHRRSVGMFQSISFNSVAHSNAKPAHQSSHFKSRPNWNAPPKPKMKKIYAPDDH